MNALSPLRLRILTVATVLVTFLPVAYAHSSDELQQLFDDHWESQLRERPQFATRTGDRRFNDRLSRVSLADVERRNKKTQAFLNRAEAIDSDKLTPHQQVSLSMFIRLRREDLQEHRFGTYLMPISNRGGFHVSFPELAKEVPLATLEDYENYLARLNAFQQYAAGHIELLREGVRRGITQPAVIFEGWQEVVDAQIVDDPTKSLLYAAVQEFPDSVPQSERERLATATSTAISEVVVPAYRRFRQFMAEEYLPNCRSSVGALALPAGREFYRYRVRRFTTLDISPEKVHQRGLAEVKRIRGEMQTIIEKVGFIDQSASKATGRPAEGPVLLGKDGKTGQLPGADNNKGDFAAFVEHLRTSPEFYAKTEDELLNRCAFVLKSADGRLPALFGKLPRMPYGIRPVPKFIAAKMTAAYYKRPAGDRSDAGFYYLNTYNLPSRPLYTLEALSLHEAVPGHHLQIALQQELENVPTFRRYNGFTAFVEGWALYAERLGLEMGFYEDPYSDFGRLTMEIWRASRLVVDTGLHYFGWTREQAIDFLKQNSAMSEHNIRAEVDRYIGWPGQALAYKTGELKIRELRATAEEKLGDAFDIRAFHDVVLGSGAVPLDVLEDNVEAWITKQAADR